MADLKKSDLLRNKNFTKYHVGSQYPYYPLKEFELGNITIHFEDREHRVFLHVDTALP